MVPDGRTDGRNGRTHGQRQNYIPPTSSGDKKNGIRTPVLLNLLNMLRKSDKMLCKPRILSIFLNSLNKFNKI